jgi:hypothetical protein
LVLLFFLIWWCISLLAAHPHLIHPPYFAHDWYPHFHLMSSSLHHLTPVHLFLDSLLSVCQWLNLAKKASYSHLNIDYHCKKNTFILWHEEGGKLCKTQIHQCVTTQDYFNWDGGQTMHQTLTLTGLMSMLQYFLMAF